MPVEDICMLADWCEKKCIRLIVDESFVDFSEGWEHNTLLSDKILATYPHMLVMKSISKSYGVPGIRLGILCSADVDIISRIKKMVSIWNLNSFCEFFMQIYTKYEKDYKKACNKFIEERNDFEAKLRTIGFLRVIPSQANYFLVEVLPPFTTKTLVLRMLKEHNILMRDCSGKGGFDNKQYMRIAVRDHDDNARLIESLRMIGEGL
jgi:histidinol-phosphate/aromatic aminotransferase/cobyric acid decarboxylase-like protein